MCERLVWAAAVLVATLAPAFWSARADTLTPVNPGPADERVWFTTAYVSQWVSTSLPEIPTAAATGNLKLGDAYFAGIGIGRTIIPSFSVPLPFCSCDLQNFRFEAEAQFTKHFGLEQTPEVAAALVLRTPRFPLGFGFSVDAAVGEGGSYNIELPKFEGTPLSEGPKAVGPHHFLNYMIYEFEFTQERWQNMHFVLQVHHRSGVWGVIAPTHSGGNYLGFGLRLDFG